MPEMQSWGGSGSASAAVTMPAQTPRAKPIFDADDIENDILAGLPNQVGRMRDAYDNLRYAMGRFEEYPTRHKDMRFRSPAIRRTSLIFQRIVHILTMHLYKKSPTRKLRDPQASAWLESVYRRNFMAPKFKRSDELSLIGGYAAFQFCGSKDPQVPIDIRLWGAEQTAFWVDPDDPTKAKAAATLDFWDNQRRLQLYTEESIRTYTTTKGATHPAFGGAAFQKAGKGYSRPNPYRDREGKGIVPFEFVHWDFPTQEFSTNSPGVNLRDLNQGVNERVDLLGDSIYFNCKPLTVAENVDDSFTMPAEVRPGDVLYLPAADVDLGGNGPTPTLRFLMPDLNYVDKDWADLNAFLDHSLEMYGVPPSLIRMVQSGANSGAALQVEQLPILGWVEGRRGNWLCYEDAIALKAMQVAAAHLSRFPGLEAEVAELYAAIDDWHFSLRWPPLFVELPGPERDRSDGQRMKWRTASLVTVVAERQDLTDEEAIEHLVKVKQQNDQLAALGINPFPEDAQPFGGGFGGFGAGPGLRPPPLPQQLDEGYGQPQPSNPNDGQGPPNGSTSGDHAEETQSWDSMIQS